jgi:hypothetical protein
LQRALSDQELDHEAEPSDELQPRGEQEVGAAGRQEHPDPFASQTRDPTDVDLLVRVGLGVVDREDVRSHVGHAFTIPQGVGGLPRSSRVSN